MTTQPTRHTAQPLILAVLAALALVLTAGGAAAQPPGDGVKSVDFTCTTVDVVTNGKDISNVVLEFTDGTTQRIEGEDFGTAETFSGTGEHEGDVLTGVWVKAGNNSTEDSPPGTGEHFSSDVEGCDEDTTSATAPGDSDAPDDGTEDSDAPDDEDSDAPDDEDSDAPDEGTDDSDDSDDSGDSDQAPAGDDGDTGEVSGEDSEVLGSEEARDDDTESADASDGEGASADDEGPPSDDEDSEAVLAAGTGDTDESAAPDELPATGLGGAQLLLLALVVAGLGSGLMMAARRRRQRA